MTTKDNPQNDHQNDQEVNDYLAGDSLLSTLYAEHSNEQTPADLDNFVIAAAGGKPESGRAQQQPGKAGKSSRPKRRPRRWMQPLAAVATLVLGLALTLDLLQDQAILRPDEMPVPPGAQTQSEPQPEAQSRLEKGVSRSDTLGSSKPQSQTDLKNAGQKRNALPPEAIAPDHAPDTDPEQDAEQAPRDPSRASAAQSGAPATKPAPAPSPNIETETQNESKQSGTPARQASQRASEPAAADAGAQQRAPIPQSNTTAQQPQKAPGPTVEGEPLSAKDIPEPIRQAQPEAGSADTAAEAAGESLQAWPPQPVQESAKPAQPEYRESAQSWIQHIVFLNDTGKQQQARDELRAFRERFPERRIPQELQALSPP